VPRRRVRPRRILVVGTALLVGVVVIGSVLLWQRVSAFNAEVSSASSVSSVLFGPLGGQERVNVLLVGYSGDPKHGGTYLADSLNIISVDPVTNTTTLIPIPRDIWIQGLPEMPNDGKVNEAFADGWDAGGWQNAGAVEVEVVSKITGLTIDHFIAIDFAGFAAMVDAVGGVTVNNPTAFKYTWSEGNYQAHRWTGGSFAKGILHLNGTRALDYARNRYTSVPAESSDFARSVRQQRVLTALRAKVGSGLGSIGPALAIMDAVKGHLHTDLSAIDLFLLSGHMQIDRRLALPEDVALTAGVNSAGSYILFPTGAKRLGDYRPLQHYIATEIAKPIPSPSPTPTGSS
jgi:polyisoprenyl-teichoic acid--peptidoglycan teichoic acid transferase